MVGQGLGRRECVCKSFEYRQADDEGTRYRSDRLFLIVRPNSLDLRRLGLVVSRRVGNAVERNKVKRWIRETFRNDKQRFPDHCDLVVIVRGGWSFQGFADLRDELLSMARGGKILAKRAGRPRRRR
ncbi:MAG: ribonuclease P protein component [Candidatus Alcyoniella australis]|nr:ribonuclease P protein component [Candidatus Alcyoniella australis]